jgi:hypothetical protein
MKRLTWSAVLCGALLLLAAARGSLQAQSSIPAPGPCDTGTSNNGACRLHLVVTNTIQPTRQLTVAPSPDFMLSPSSGQLTSADYMTGAFDVAGSLRVSVSSTTAWRVTIQAASASMLGSCAARPASSITWGLTAGSRTMPLSTSPATIASGSNSVVNQGLDLYFRATLDWLRDAPSSAATCSLPVSFTVTAP